jgi:hypothetical protein
MPLREERSFDADGPVGAYWLRNSTGFRVVTPRRRAGRVEEVGVRESDGRVDVLAVRKRGLFRSHVKLISADRVTLVRPWDETIVLAPKRRRRPVAELPAAPTPAVALEPETVVLPPAEPRPEPTTAILLPAEPEPATEIVQPPEPEPPKAPKPPREPRVGPAMRTAGAASGRGLLAAAVLAAYLARGFAHYALVFMRAVGVQLVLAFRLIRRHAPTVGRFVAELAAFGVAAVAGLGRFTAAYFLAWRGAIAEWRAARRWQESRPEPPAQVRPPSPNGSRPGAAPTRAAPPSRRG